MIFNLILLALALGHAGALLAAEPDESLHDSDLGVYGSAWMPWLKQHDRSFDFVVYQFGPGRPLATIAEDLHIAADSGLRVVLSPKLPDMDKSEPVSARGQSVLLSVQRVLDTIVDTPVAAITIGDENIFWDDMSSVLSEAYELLRSEYPERSFYQWYSPSRKMNIPGIQWPDLPADGWVFDQYHYGPEFYREFVQGLSRKQLPLVSIIWASPMWQPGSQQPEKNGDWWETRGWERFYDQLKVNRANNIPTAFYLYELRQSGQRLPLFRSEGSCEKRFMTAFTARTISTLNSMPELPTRPDDRPDWIPAACGGE
jgi:hypothetical protein